jgi:hypothetical protein
MEKLESQARARVIKWFQVTAKNKILWLSEKEYLKRLSRPGYRLGWVDQHHIYFGTGFLLSQDLLTDILAQGWPRGHNP